MALILASSSPWRRALLERLGLPFECVSPDVDETPLAGEAPADLAARLARAKAAAVGAANPEAWVIGSDQVACLQGRILGKPGGFERAREQLHACSGARVEFLTGLCLQHGEYTDCVVEPFAVEFRDLQAAEIETYLRRDTPYDCAGSFRWESLGIALFRRLDGADPTALEGLPLIRLCQMLRSAGLDPLS